STSPCRPRPLQNRGRRVRRPLGRAYYSSMATEATRKRLDPDVFRLPADKIREGYYTDAYFNFTKALLEQEGRHPVVTMQVFQKKHSVLGGVDEAIAVLKECAGRNGPAGWEPGWDELEVCALHEGDE